MLRVPGILWIAAGAALWGTDTILRRPLTGVLDPIQIVLFEHLILAVIVAPIVLRRRSLLPKISTSTWLAILGTAVVGSALSTILFTAAIRSGSPTTAVLLQKTQPVFAIILARFVLRERWPARFPWIAVTAIAGAYLIAFGQGNLLAPATSLETSTALLSLGAAAGWALATICGRTATRALPFELVTALRILLALPVLVVAATVQGSWSIPPPPQLLTLVWLALLPGFASLMLYYRGLRQTPASQATIGELAFPASALFLNWVVLGFAPADIQILGFAIVWLAIFYLSRLQRSA